MRVTGGQVAFQPTLLREREFLNEAASFTFYGVSGKAESLTLQPAQLGFTYCQVPVVYSKQGNGNATVTYSSGKQEIFENGQLDADVSASLFMKLGDVARIDVSVASTLD